MGKFGRNLFRAAALSAVLLQSCADVTWNDPVEEYFKLYTETAEIEKEVVPDTHLDGSARRCVSSDGSLQMTFYMRNPQKYALVLGLSLPGGRDGSSVKVEQSEYNEITVTMPREFLVAADEGGDISPTISLHEPMTGRDFASHFCPLICNTVPPKVENPTVLNDGDSTFAVAFDMPSAAEMGLRHKDVVSLVLNGAEYALTVGADGSFSFPDPRFSREDKPSYKAIKGKTFTHTPRSVYFATGEPFSADDRAYTLVLRDRAAQDGETASADSSITKLDPPSISFNAGDGGESGGRLFLFTKDGGPGRTVVVTPPTRDHRGNVVSGASVSYRLFSGRDAGGTLVSDGESSSRLEIPVGDGDWYIEAWATRSGFERSATASADFRVQSLDIYVSAGGSDEGDGSEARPFATVSRAVELLGEICGMGFGGWTYRILVSGAVSGNFTLGGELPDGIRIEGRSGASSDVLSGDGSDSVVTVSTSSPVSFANVGISGGGGSAGGGIIALSGSSVTLGSGAVVRGCSAENGGGVYVGAGGSLSVSGGSITSCTAENGGGAYVRAGGSLSVSGGSITSCTAEDGGGVYVASSGSLTLSGGKVVSGADGGCDVFLPTGAAVTLSGAVAEGSATITPSDYGSGTGTSAVVALGDLGANAAELGGPGSGATYIPALAVTQPEGADGWRWRVRGDGRLAKFVDVSDGGGGAVVGFSISGAGGDVSVKVNGTEAADFHSSASSGSVTFAAEDGLSSCVWKFDGEVVAGAGRTCTVDLSELPSGVYDVFFTATKDGEPVSWTAQIRR